MLTRRSLGLALILIAVIALAIGCGRKPAIEQPTAEPPEPMQDVPSPPEEPVERVDTGDFDEPDIPEAPPMEGTLDEQIRRSLKTVYFAFDRYDLSEDTLRILKDNASTLAANPSWQVRVDGHCDERGTIEYNLELGAKRARAVMDYLVSLGVPADRLETRSYGEERPEDSGHTESAWAKNRRAEFVAAGS
jgi:peptidoglycan-associated lipoprotein